MTLVDQVNAKIAELDARIAFVQDRAQDEVQALAKQRNVLVGAKALITDDLEKAVAALQRLGFIRIG